MRPSFYFDKFEGRTPYEPIADSYSQSKIFQVFGVLTLLTGLTYICWRWGFSLNHDAIVFSLILAVAETVSFVSIFFFVFEMWSYRDFQKKAPPHLLSDIQQLDGQPDRPLKVDVFIATYNEEVELVRLTIKDAKAMTYPFKDVRVKIFVLDDGRRDGRDPAKENMKAVCEEENVKYLTRETNLGFKAGNLKNGLANSSGDVFVILDADARPYPGFLANTLGYFREHKVAWVQTCQWFYDTTEAIPLKKYLTLAFNIRSPRLKKLIGFLSCGLYTGEDIYGNDPRQFYQVIQRKRNNYNASFCCGAGSVHRREAVMASAVQNFSETLVKEMKRKEKKWEADHPVHTKLVKTIELTPFRFHASEDLYTSMIMHSDAKNRWLSVMHPYVECKMLSPQDISTWVKQRTRYAEGSIDIFLQDNPLFKKGLTWQQKICYFNSVFSYFSCIWTLVFLFSPIYFFFFHIMPVACDTRDFFIYFLPFFIMIKCAEVASGWGVSQKRGRQYHICQFWLNLSAIVKVVSGKKISFNVTPKKKQKSRPFLHCWPHIVIVSLTLIGLALNLDPDLYADPQYALAMLVNGLWALQNAFVLMVFVRAAYWNTELYAPTESEKQESHINETQRSPLFNAGLN